MSQNPSSLSPANTTYRDLRDWLEYVDRLGELKVIRGANRDLEMAGIWEITSRNCPSTPPVLVFDDIPGFPSGYRTLFGDLESVKRIALTLNLNLGRTDILSCVKACRERLRQMVLVPPRKVTGGEVLENIDKEEKVDLYKFPAPKHHEQDGGRFIGTGHCVITQDPDEGWINLGTYRCMLQGKQELGLHMSAGRDGRTMLNKYFARGQSFKVAVAIGVDPALHLASSMTVPWGTSEYDFAGGLKGEAVEILEGPFSKLPIPAHAEIVIEGECFPGETKDEGPFGEWAGYYANCGLSPVKEPIIRVKTVLYRTDPILTCAQPAKPPSDLFAQSVFRSALIWDEMEKAGVPGVQGVWCDLAGGSRLFNVVAIRQLYPGHARQVGMIASQCNSGVYIGRYTVVVDDDIDITDLREVIWAISTRADPEGSVEIIRRCRSSSADPAISPDVKATTHNPDNTFTSKAIIDACWPYEWKDRAFPVAEVSSELRKQIIDRWSVELREFLSTNGSERGV